MDTLLELEKEQRLSYEVLDETFYKNCRNEITEKRLAELSRLAEEMGEREIYGDYSSPSDYLKALKITLGSTMETRHCGTFLYRKILPFLRAKKNFLDVGPGNGRLTRWIGRRFQKITAIDTNQLAINKFPFIHPNTDCINKICDSILNAQLQSNLYDLSLISHALYYINSTQWTNVISKLYRATKPGGIIVLILAGDNFGKGELIKNFGGETPDIDGLFQNCHQLFPKEKISGFSSKGAFISKQTAEMLHISGFMLYDAGVIAPKEALIKYINKHFKLEDNSFCMTSQQKFISIYKS